MNIVIDTKPMKKRVAVLMGGFSGERDVSLSTAEGVIKALHELGHDVIEIDVTRDIRVLVDALTPKPDVALNVLHGRWGEDGCIQGLLEMMEIPYTHSGVLSSSLSMNKVVTRRICEAAGIRCPEGIIADITDVRAGHVMKRPFVIKPINEGSSLGVHIISEGVNGIPHEDVWSYGRKVLVEKYIPGREINVGVVAGKAIGAVEIIPHQGFYDYDAKYTEGKATHLMPAPLHPDAYKQALRWAELAHENLGCRGVSRSDFRYDDTKGEPGELYFLEINSQPGMTPLSLLPEIAAYSGITYTQLVQWMVEDASCHR